VITVLVRAVIMGLRRRRDQQTRSQRCNSDENRGES
jgi:hypothetical protein